MWRIVSECIRSVFEAKAGVTVVSWSAWPPVAIINKMSTAVATTAKKLNSLALGGAIDMVVSAWGWCVIRPYTRATQRKVKNKCSMAERLLKA